MKANTTSKKGMPDGQEYMVQVYAPTFEEWMKHFGGASQFESEKPEGLARFAADYNQHKVANNLASRLKSAMAQQIGKDGVSEKPKAETVAANAELVRKLKAGEVFDLRDFVSAEPRAKGDGFAAIIAKNVKAIEEKWATSPNRATFLKNAGLPAYLIDKTSDEVKAAYLAKMNAGDDL